MQLLPVPTDHAAALRVFWEPFLPGIALAGNQTPEDMADDILTGRVIALLVWDEAATSAKALAGVEILTDAKGRLICHLVWCTGQDMTEWRHLLADIELWAKDHMGCARIRATHRPGWTRFLHTHGYRDSHRISEKELLA
jgi:hypothetical protein